MKIDDLYTCVALALTALLSVDCLQDIPERGRYGRAYTQYFQDLNSKDAEKLVTKVPLTAPRTWNSKVDNFDSSSNSTFLQRYYENDLYWKNSGSKGPVFFVISGEGDVSISLPVID